MTRHRAKNEQQLVDGKDRKTVQLLSDDDTKYFYSVFREKLKQIGMNSESRNENKEI